MFLMSGAKSQAVTRNLVYRPDPRPYGRVGRLAKNTDEIVDVPYVRYALIGKQDNIVFVQERIMGADQVTIIDSRILFCIETTAGSASCLLYEVYPFSQNPEASYAYMLGQGIQVDTAASIKFDKPIDINAFHLLRERYQAAIQQQQEYNAQLQWWQHQQQHMFMQQQHLPPPQQLFMYQQHAGLPVAQSYVQASVESGKEKRQQELQRREQEVAAAQTNLEKQQTEAAKTIEAESSEDFVKLLQDAMERYTQAQADAGELRTIVAQDQVVVAQSTALILNPVEMCPSSTFLAFNNLIAKHNKDSGTDDPNGLLIGLLGLCKDDQYLQKLDVMEFMSFLDGANPPVGRNLCLAVISAQYEEKVLIDVDLDKSLVKKLNFALLTRLLHLLRNAEENRSNLSLVQWQQIMGLANACKDGASVDELAVYSSVTTLCSPQIARLTPATKSAPAAKAAATSAKKAPVAAKASKAASKKGSSKTKKEDDDDFEAAIAEATQEQLKETGKQAEITAALQQDFDRYAVMVKSEDGTIAFYKELADGGKYDLERNLQKFADLMHATNAEGQNLLMLLLESDVMRHSDLYMNISSITTGMAQYYKKTASEKVKNDKNVFQHKDGKGRGLLDYCVANVNLDFNPDLQGGEYFDQFRPGLELLIGAYGMYRAVLANLPSEVKQGLDPNVPRKFNLQPAVNFLKTKSGTTFVHTLFSRLDLNNKAHRDYVFNMLKQIFPDNVQSTRGTLAMALSIARNEDGKNLHNIIEDLTARKNEKDLERWLLSMYDRIDLYTLDLSRFLSPSVVGGQQEDRCISAIAFSTDAVDYFRAHNPTRDPIMKLVEGAEGYHSDKDVVPEIISEIFSKRAQTRPTKSHNANSYAIFRDNDHLCTLLDYYCAESPPAVDKARAYIDNLLRIMRSYTKYNAGVQKSDQETTKQICEHLLSTAINYMFYEKAVDFSHIMSLMDMLMQKAESSEEERKAIWIRYYTETLDVYIRTVTEPYKSKALLMMQYLAPKCDLDFVAPETKQNVMHKIFGRIAEALQQINKKQADQFKGVLVRLLMAVGVVARGDKEKIGALLIERDSTGKTPLDLINDGLVKLKVERVLINHGYKKPAPGVGLKLTKG